MTQPEWKIEDDGTIHKTYDASQDNRFQYKKIALYIEKIKDEFTNKFKLKIEFNVIPANEERTEEIRGCAYCSLLGLDEELINLREYGCILSRPDVMDIKKLIEDNFMIFKTKSSLDGELDNYKAALFAFKEYLEDSDTSKNSNTSENSDTSKNSNTSENSDTQKNSDTSNYCIPVKEFNDTLFELGFEKSEVMAVRKWLSKENYIESYNAKVVKCDSKAKRVIVFNKDNCNKFFKEYENTFKGEES